MSYIAIWGNISTGDPIQLPIFGSFEFFLQFLGSGRKIYSKASCAGLEGSFCLAESPMSTISVANGTSKLKRVNFERVEVDIFDTTYFWRIGDLQM